MQNLSKIVSTSQFALFKCIQANFAKNSLFKPNRTFLTESYFCYEEWDKYLMSDLMKQIGTVNSFSIELDEKLKENNLVTPLDMEILASKTVHINNFQELDFIENIFLKFRKTQPALYVKDTMHYALVRSYLDLNQAERLLGLLKLKYKYGLYGDTFTLNMLMDYFIREKDFEKAALTAHEVMLQEMTDNQLTLAACLFSCVKCSRESLDTYVQQDEEASGDKEKLLVYFKRRDWSDEHFDLKSIRELNGKTIWFASSYLESVVDLKLVNSLKIYGLLLFGKFDQVVELFEQVYLKDKGQLYEFLVEEINKVHKTLSDSESLNNSPESLAKWTDLNALCECDNGVQLIDSDILIELEELLKSTTQVQSDKDVAEQKELFVKWENEQTKELSEQINNFNIEIKKASILKRLEDLERQEEILTYFDKEQEILNTYHNQGFSNEDPADIPIEPEESVFKNKFERHFKPYQKYANRPEHTLTMSISRRDALESLRKIYFDNRQAQTNYDPKLKARN